MSTTQIVSVQTPSDRVLENQNEPACSNTPEPWGKPSIGEERLLRVMDREANKALCYLSWSPDMIGRTMMTICARLCNAHRLFSSYESVKLLFCQLSPHIEDVWEENLFSDDWTSSHQHSYSNGCKFLCSASDLLRNLVFESRLQHAVGDLVPCDTELEPLSTAAPRLYQLFKMASLRAGFETINVDNLIAPLFPGEYERLIGTLYEGKKIKARLIDAVQVAARLYTALSFYPDIRFRYDALSADMVLDMYTLRPPMGKAWKTILPAITVVDTFGGEMILVKAMAFNDSSTCQSCPDTWITRVS